MKKTFRLPYGSLVHRAESPKLEGFTRSESLAHVLRTYHVHVPHVPACKLRRELVAVTDKIKRKKFPGIVNKIPCADCDYCYIGESGNFERQLREHMNDSEIR